VLAVAKRGEEILVVDEVYLQNALPGADPGVRELPVSRAAGASPDLGIADRCGQSRDQGVVLLAVRPVWGGVSAGAAAVDSVSDYVMIGGRGEGRGERGEK